MIEHKIYKSPWKAIKLILLCTIFVVGGFYMLNSTSSSNWIAWLSIIFFGLGYPIALYHLLDRRPQIVINEIGIFDRSTHKDFINWEIIQNAYLAEVHGQKFICLEVNQQFEPSNKKGKLARKVAGVSKALGFQELNISLANVKINAERLTEFIGAMRLADKPKRQILLEQIAEHDINRPVTNQNNST